MEIQTWEKFFEKLGNFLENMQADVYTEKDEVKAMGELALLEKDINYFIQKNWVE